MKNQRFGTFAELLIENDKSLGRTSSSKRRRHSKRPSLATRLARKVMQEYAKSWDDRTSNLSEEDFIQRMISNLPADQLGVIAASGREYSKGSTHSLYEVHCGTWLNKYSSGIELLEQIAQTAIIAEMRRLRELDQAHAQPKAASSSFSRF